jgi:hypothetical protein
MLVSACVTSGSGDAFCATNSPTYLTAAEISALSDETAKKITADNEYGERHCGWKPRRRAK